MVIVQESCSGPAGLLNIRSVNNKTENVPNLFEEHCLNLLILTETWHEHADSVVIKRLRSMELNVIEAARNILPTTRLDNAHFVNHGGIALVSKPGINVAKVETKMKPKTFEHLCCRVGGGLATRLLVAIYRSGSQRVSDKIFREFSTLLEMLATFNSANLVAGDMNIHLERPDDVDSQRFAQLDGHGFQQIVREPMHEHGGLLDVVLTSVNEMSEEAVVSESGLSDHKVVHWTIPTVTSCPEYKKVLCRRWNSLNTEAFITKIKESSLNQPVDSSCSATELVDHYHSEITGILDELVPVTEMSLRSRPQRPFYNGEC